MNPSDLDSGYRSPTNSFTFSFATQMPGEKYERENGDPSTFQPYPETVRDGLRHAFSVIEDVVNMKFEEVQKGGDLVFAGYNITTPNVAAYTDLAPTTDRGVYLDTDVYNAGLEPVQLSVHESLHHTVGFLHAPAGTTDIDSIMVANVRGPIRDSIAGMDAIELASLFGVSHTSSNTNFVRGLYDVFLNRAPDDGGFGVQLNALENGMSREAMMDGFFHSSELTGMRIYWSIFA